MRMYPVDIIRSLDERPALAVAHYWKTRQGQRDKQKQTGKADQGLRSAVTGGAQMDGFIDLFTELITDSGIANRHVFRSLHLRRIVVMFEAEHGERLVVSPNTPYSGRRMPPLT